MGPKEYKYIVPTCDSANIITTALAAANQSKVICSANIKRQGLYIYNNCGNSIYVAFADTSISSSQMTVIIASFQHWIMPFPIYRGVLSAIKNAGTTGSVIVTELVRS